MEARTQGVKGVFQNDTLLVIPYYQRRYVWNNSPEYMNWTRFAEDMESTMDTDSSYFLGALILKSDKRTEDEVANGVAKKRVVVDGQQRLTTMAIYMKLLHQLTARENEFESYYQLDNDRKDPTIKHNCEDLRDFNSIILSETPGKREGNSLIIEANNFFYDRFMDLRKKGVDLNELRKAINSHVSFVVIELSQEEDEQQIFDTINSLGVDLTTDELLKNFLYEAADEDRYKQTWKVMFDNDKSKEFWGTDAASQKQTKKDKVLDRFLHAFVKLKMWDFDLSPIHRKEFVKSSNVYKACKSFYDTYGMSKQELADEILEYAKIYRKNLNDEILNDRIPQSAGIKRLACLINANKSYAVLPYVLYVLGCVNDEAEQNKIFGFLETYLVRRLLCKSSSNSYSDLFAENLINNKINTFDKLREYIIEKDPDSNLAMPTDEELKLSIGQVKLDETIAKTILYLYETKLRSPNDDGCLTSGINDYCVERMMPKPSAQANMNWQPIADYVKENERKQLIQTLGNAFMLELENVDEKQLKRIRNKSFNDKKEFYKPYIGNVQSSNILKNQIIWDISSIESRNENFARIFSERIWKLS